MSTQPSCPACGHDELNGHAICPKCGADAAGMAHFAQKWERGETGGDGKLRTTLVWTRFDGTPETLPEEDGGVVLVVRGGNAVPASIAHEDDDGEISTWWDLPRGHCERVSVGDMWAPWPEAPEAV